MALYNKVDIEVLKELIEGEVHDVYLFIKKHCYRDMYMTIHEYTLAELSECDSLERFIKVALKDYKMQNRLNKSLKVTDGKHFDYFLMRCIVGLIFERYKDCEALKNETIRSFITKVVEEEAQLLDNRLISEHNVLILTGILKSKFENKKNLTIEEVNEFIESISPTEQEIEIEGDFFEYFNKLIKDKHMTLNQLGNESLIKKGIYEISLGKQPNKNQLVMLMLALKLDKEEREMFLLLAKEQLKNTADSNMYSFEKGNERDTLILHWLDNMDELQTVVEKRKKSVVEIVNDILKGSNFEILR